MSFKLSVEHVKHLQAELLGVNHRHFTNAAAQRCCPIGYMTGLARRARSTYQVVIGCGLRCVREERYVLISRMPEKAGRANQGEKRGGFSAAGNQPPVALDPNATHHASWPLSCHHTNPFPSSSPHCSFLFERDSMSLSLSPSWSRSLSRASLISNTPQGCCISDVGLQTQAWVAPAACDDGGAYRHVCVRLASSSEAAHVAVLRWRPMFGAVVIITSVFCYQPASQALFRSEQC
jgi:hypothetical protein